MPVWTEVNLLPILTSTGFWHQHIRIGASSFALRWLEPSTGATSSRWAARAAVYRANSSGEPLGAAICTAVTRSEVLSKFFDMLSP